MNAQTPPMRPALPDITANRHATTLAEIQQMTEDFRRMQSEVAGLHRDLDARDNKIDLLEKALSESRDGEKVYRRKLIRLAAAMSNIGLLSREAEAIMKDSREVDEVMTEAEAEAATLRAT